MGNTFTDIVDLRPVLPAVRDQGIHGTCVAFAVTACHEQHRRHDAILSEEFLYGCCKIVDGNALEGTSVMTALKVLKRIGQAKAEMMPYNHQGSSNFHNMISLAVYREAKTRRIQGSQQILPTPKVIENFIDKEQPVVAVVEVHPCFFNPVSGSIDIPTNESMEGLHAILIVGYSERNDGKSFFIIRNSWGTHWGDNGYAYLSYDYLSKYKRGSWVI
jgi:C1A family cysteine protease